MTDKVQVTEHAPIPPRPRSRLRAISRRLVRVVMIVAVVGAMAAGYRLATRHAFRVTVSPGGVMFVEVEVPMRRFASSTKFAKRPNLPVRCTVSRNDARGDGVTVTVAKTHHTINHLRAKLRVQAARGAPAGHVRREIDFVLDGEGGWPTAELVVSVTAGDGP
jgi:hypothetical protein